MKIVKVPGINGLNHTNGTDEAPEAILESLRSFYANSQGKAVNVDSLNVEKLDLKNENVVEDNKIIYEKAYDSFESNQDKIIFLGGDHSVSYSLTRGFFDSCQNRGNEPCLIIFDSHPDLMEPVDRAIPTHEEWLRALIMDGFPVKNILLVGLRNSDIEEINFIREHNIRQITIDQFLENFEDVIYSLMEFSHGKELYVSLDIDFVDPLFAPATGYPVPGGLNSSEFLYIVKKIAKIKTLRGVDLVEINPSKDTKNKMTVNLGAKILSELI